MGIIQETKTEKITALYCRVSTDAQLDGYSIDAQAEILESYCKAKQIYNYKFLKEDLILKGHKFSTESDTEV